MAPFLAVFPIANFDGLGQSTNYLPQAAPPDTNVTVGLNDVVELVNSAYGSIFQVYDKTGKAIGSPILLNNLWSTAGGACINSQNNIGGMGDGVVVYDQMAERYLITQFAVSGTAVHGTSPVPTDECIAVSETSDPLGAYYLYDFPVSRGEFADYPKISVWPDAYYASFNLYNRYGSLAPIFLGVGYVAFERQAMLDGNPDARMIVIKGTGDDLAYSALPASLEGSMPPPTGSPEIYLNYVSPYLWGSGTPYALELRQMHVDWTNPLSSSLTGPTQIGVTPFNDGICQGQPGCIPEPGPGEVLDALGDRLMFPLGYRDGVGSDGHQVLVVNQTVGANGASPPSGIRWYELDAPAGATDPSQWNVKQQSTYAPPDGTSRWMGSVAMDSKGDIGLGYSLSSPDLDPSVAFTGRLAGDAPDTMTVPETTLVMGTGVQEATQYRWGDYSSMVLDPADDCTFWYAQEYYAATGTFYWSTHIGSFDLDSSCAPSPRGTVSGQVTDASTGSPLVGADVELLPNRIDAVTDQNGNYTISAPAGAYTVEANEFGYQQNGQSVTVSNAVTSTENLALQPSSTVTVSGTVTDAGHGYGLYAEVTVEAVPGGGQAADVWTNPQTGQYSVNLPQGYNYTIAVNPYLSGFDPGHATINDLASATTQDFSLKASPGCSALGYGAVFGQDFDHGFPPPGWSVTNAIPGSPDVWQSNGYWADSNWATAKGSAATVDALQSSVMFGYTGNFDTSLITPPIPVSTLPAVPIVQFALNMHTGGPLSLNSGLTGRLDIDQSTDGGVTWTNLASLSGNYGALYPYIGSYGLFWGKPVYYQVPVMVPSGASNIELRWRFYDIGSNNRPIVQIDNVSIGTCQPLAGVMIEGQVTGLTSRAPLPGAQVYDNRVPTKSAVTYATDSATQGLPQGHYFYFAKAASGGQVTLTASDEGYVSESKTINITNDTLINQNFALGTTQFSSNTSGFDIHVMVNNQVTQALSITNNGSVAGPFKLIPVDAPPPTTAQVARLNSVPVIRVHCERPIDPGTIRDGTSPIKTGCTFNKHGLPEETMASNVGTASAWQSIADYPIPIMENAVTSDPNTGKVYSVGGIAIGGGGVLPFSYVYDPHLDQWTRIADAPDSFNGATADFVNGKLYVAFAEQGADFHNLYVYDLSKNVWTVLPGSQISPISGMASAVIGDKIYYVGGCTTTQTACPSGEAQVYETTSNAWTAIAPYPHGVSWASCGNVDNKLYCAGGEYVGTQYSDGYVYDPKTNVWSPIAPIPVSSGGLWGSYYAGTTQGLIVSGGILDNSKTFTNQGYIYDPKTNSWSSIPNSPEVTFQGGSTCGFYRIGGSVIVPGRTGVFLDNPISTSRVLPGYGQCGSAPISWLTLSPASATVAASGIATAQLTFDGTGEKAGTTSQAYLDLVGLAPYQSIAIPLTVHWDPQPIDLSVSAAANRALTNVGGDLTYTVKVSNLNETNHGAASVVVLTMNLPQDSKYISATGQGTCTASSAMVSCSLGSIPLGAADTETIVVKPTGNGTFTSTFTATANEPDSDMSNNSASVSTPVSSGGGGGGGGATSWLLLVFLMQLLIWRSWGLRKRIHR